MLFVTFFKFFKTFHIFFFVELAFNIAESEFGIPRLIEAGDVLAKRPDERSIMTYVSGFAHKFDIMGKLDSKIKTLDVREQQIAMKEAELERIAYENDQKLKEQRQAQLMELERKENALRASHQRLTTQEEQQKKELERAIAMQREADEKIRNASLLEKQMQKEADQEKQRLAELERKLKEQADALAAQQAAFQKMQEESRSNFVLQQEQYQQQVREQERLDAIEKEFGESANALDLFLANERNKLNDGNTDVTTLQQMVHYGIPYGEGLIQRVRDAAQDAIKAGLKTNRYTTANLPEQEQRWKKLIYDMQQRLQSMLHPPTPPPVHLPAIPFNETFQPFRIAPNIEKEPMLLLDITASMNAPIGRRNETPRLDIVKEAIKLLVDQLHHLNKNKPMNKRRTEGGLRTITFAGGQANDMNLLTPSNFEPRWKGINWEGNTRIMPGWRLLEKAFTRDFGHRAVQERPVMLALVVTDGEALDIEEFERTLAQDKNAYVVICIVGYGEDHDSALSQFTIISKTNDRLKVIPLKGADDAPLIAGTLLSMVQN